MPLIPFTKISDLPGANKPNHWDSHSSIAGGRSSSYLSCVLSGQLHEKIEEPHDADDFSRCILVYENFLADMKNPRRARDDGRAFTNINKAEYTHRLNVLKRSSRSWEALIEGYEELKQLFLSNASAHKITSKMQDLKNKYLASDIKPNDEEKARQLTAQLLKEEIQGAINLSPTEINAFILECHQLRYQYTVSGHKEDGSFAYAHFSPLSGGVRLLDPSIYPAHKFTIKVGAKLPLAKPLKLSGNHPNALFAGDKSTPADDAEHQKPGLMLTDV